MSLRSLLPPLPNQRQFSSPGVMEKEERRRRRKDERRSVAVFIFRPPFSQVGVYAMQIRSVSENPPTKLGEIPAAEESFSPPSLVKEQADNTPRQTLGWGGGAGG